MEQRTRQNCVYILKLIICDNIARHYALARLQKSAKVRPQLAGTRTHPADARTAGMQVAEAGPAGARYTNDPLLQVIEANEKYLVSAPAHVRRILHNQLY